MPPLAPASLPEATATANCQPVEAPYRAVPSSPLGLIDPSRRIRAILSQRGTPLTIQVFDTCTPPCQISDLSHSACGEEAAIICDGPRADIQTPSGPACPSANQARSHSGTTLEGLCRNCDEFLFSSFRLHRQSVFLSLFGSVVRPINRFSPQNIEQPWMRLLRNRKRCRTTTRWMASRMATTSVEWVVVIKASPSATRGTCSDWASVRS